jgi:hypothetical protein
VLFERFQCYFGQTAELSFIQHGPSVASSAANALLR